jgi:hypothetical protein
VIRVEQFDYTERFASDLRSAPEDIRNAAKDALDLLKANPRAGKLRLHRLHDYKPPLWKIDVLSNKSWQVAFEMSGTTAILRRLATHKQIDRL